MPITLIVRLGNDSSHRLSFDRAPVVIGRAESSDLRLVDASVSQRHATIAEKDGVYTVTDEGSRNGSFIGGVQLGRNTPRILRSGDLLRVGRVWLEVKLGEEQDLAPLNAAMATRDLALALVSRTMKLDAPIVRVVEGPDIGSVLRLADDQRAYVAGRGDGCDWMLNDTDVSREHVEIVRRGATVALRNLGARNSVFMGKNELAAGADVVWRSSSMVRLGATVLALEEPIDRAILEIGASEDEPADLAAAAIPPTVIDAEPAPSGVNDPPVLDAGPSLLVTLAPIAAMPVDTRAAKTKKKGPSGQDVLIVASTAIVLVLAAAVLVWLLQG